MFVKGHLIVLVAGQSLEFIHQNISVFGVSGLTWSPLSPHEHFGKEAQISLRIPAKPDLLIKTRGYLMRERTISGEHMALRFALSTDDHQRLSAHIEKNGIYPTEYLRKYPRIPSTAEIQTFPLRALVLPPERILAEASPDPTQKGPTMPWVFDVGNLSPNGICLFTENQTTMAIAPGDRLHMSLEPRGWFPMQIRVEGLVCRVTEDLHPNSGNVVRYMGIKFVRVDELNRAAFLNLLRDILAQLKTTATARPPKTKA